jgi:hypothetical protein
LAVSAVGVVVGGKRPDQRGFVDPAAGDQGLGHADHHLGVVGVVQGRGGRAPQEFVGRAELVVKDVGRQTFVRRRNASPTA